MAATNDTTRRHPRTREEAFPDPMAWWQGPKEPTEVIGESWNFRRTRRVRIATTPSLARRLLRLVWPWAN
ncbi:hypothetical protein [Caldimonas sp. KR1-144]|uniref:hypothetical protein n=1 Tax=Caldimonas sp. KR1-144 TaxID=3400911 RepID=UPI003C07DA77